MTSFRDWFTKAIQAAPPVEGDVSAGTYDGDVPGASPTPARMDKAQRRHPDTGQYVAPGRMPHMGGDPVSTRMDHQPHVLSGTRSEVITSTGHHEPGTATVQFADYSTVPGVYGGLQALPVAHVSQVAAPNLPPAERDTSGPAGGGGAHRWVIRR